MESALNWVPRTALPNRRGRGTVIPGDGRAAPNCGSPYHTSTAYLQMKELNLIAPRSEQQELVVVIN